MNMNKKVLLIAYHYPPDMAIGAQRIGQFVKYLPGVGAEPFVLNVLAPLGSSGLNIMLRFSFRRRSRQRVRQTVKSHGPTD